MHDNQRTQLPNKNRPKCYVKSPTAHFGQYQLPHQLYWDDQEMGSATSCTKCSQVAVSPEYDPRLPMYITVDNFYSTIPIVYMNSPLYSDSAGTPE